MCEQQELSVSCSVMSNSLLDSPWTVAYQAPLSMEFSRQEYSGGLPRLPLGDLPHPEIEPASLRFPALAGRFFITSATWEKKNDNQPSQPNQLSLGPGWNTRSQMRTYWICRGKQREQRDDEREDSFPEVAPNPNNSHFSDPDGHQSVLLRVFWVSVCSLQLQIPNAYQLSYATSITSCSYSYKSGWQRLHYFL